MALPHVCGTKFISLKLDLVNKSSVYNQLVTEFTNSRRLCKNRPLVLKKSSLQLGKHERSVRMMMSDGDHVNFEENDPNYVTAFPIPAVDLMRSRNGMTIKMEDNQTLVCKHNRESSLDPQSQTPQPCIVLRLEDEERTLFPLIVAKQPRDLLLDSLHGRTSRHSRPTAYQVMTEMAKKFSSEIKMIRITGMIDGIFCAEIYLGEVGSKLGKIIALEARPSDAINVAVKAKIPIQVNRALASKEGMTEIPLSASDQMFGVFGSLPAEDIAPPELCPISEELHLVSLLVSAKEEERYFDAAVIRDKLNWYRAMKSQQH